MVWVRKSALRDEWSFGHFFKIKNYSTFKGNGSVIHHEDKGKPYWVNGWSPWGQWGLTAASSVLSFWRLQVVSIRSIPSMTP